MSLTDEQRFQIETYGQPLTGGESDLDLQRMARIRYLKTKMRPRLEAAIGDTPDNLTDAVRAVILGDAIALGLVTDTDAIAAYKAYIAALLEGYGGPAAILEVLSGTSQAIGQFVVQGYFAAKAAVMAAEDEESIAAVDLEV